MQAKHHHQGFTLIEVLLAISIIAVLAGVAIPPLLRARKSSEESAAMQVLRGLRTAEVYHRTRYGRYGDLNSLVALGGSPVTEGGRDTNSGYTFTSAHSEDAFTIVAAPPRTDMSTFTLVDSGLLFGE